jgi:TP901 family phage tail tape measure protein
MSIRRDEAQLIINIQAKESAEYQKVLAGNKRAVQDIKKLEAGTEDYNKALQKQVQISKDLQKSDFSKLSIKQLQDRRAQLEQLRKTIPQVTFAESGFEKELQKVNGALRDSALRTRAVGEEMNKSNVFAQAFKASLGAITAVAAARSVAGFFTGAVNAAADFEQQMSKVQAVSGAAGEDLERLANKAKELGATTSKSATEAAQGLQFLALAGFSTEEQLVALEPVLRLSEAGAIDLGRASDLATDALSALGLGANELEGFLDIVTNTSTKSNTSIEQLTEAFISVGGQFKNLGIPLEDANALLGVLANRGEKGSEAATGLNAVLVNLTTGAGQAGKAMKELGLEVFDSEGNFRGVEDILGELNGKLAGLTQEQQATYKAMIGGKQNITTLNNLLSGMGEEFTELRDAISDSDGALNKVAKTMQDNLRGRITELKSATEGLLIAIGERLLPIVEKMVAGLVIFIGVIRSIPEFIRENEVAIKALVIGMALFNAQAISAAANSLRLAAVEKGRLIVTKAVTVAQNLLNAAMTANPIGLAVKAIGLLITGLGLLYTKSQTVRAGIAGLWNVVKEFFKIVKEAVQTFAEGFSDISEGNILSGLKKIGSSIIKTNPVALALTEGKRLGQAFKDGFDEKVAQEEDEKAAKSMADQVDKLYDGAEKRIDERGPIPIDFEIDTEKGEKPKDPKETDPDKEIRKQIQERLKVVKEGFDLEQAQLEGYLLNQLVTQEEHDARLLDIRRKNIDDQLDVLRAFGQEDTAQYVKLQNDRIKLQQDYEKKRLDALVQVGGRELEEIERLFLERLISEEEYEKMLLEEKLRREDEKLRRLEEAGLQETDIYKNTLLARLRILKDINDQEVASVARTEAIKAELRGEGVRVMGDLLGQAAQNLAADEQARKKNASAIKTFEAANVVVSGYAEVADIFRSTAKFGPAGWAVATGRALLAGLRTAGALAKINAQQFFGGGQVKRMPAGRVSGHPNIPTQPGGDNMLATLKVGEVVLNENQQSLLGGPATFRAIGVPGFDAGGLVGSTTPTPAAAAAVGAPSVSDQDNSRIDALTKGLEKLVEMMPQALSNVKADISYNTFQKRIGDVGEIERLAAY